MDDLLHVLGRYLGTAAGIAFGIYGAHVAGTWLRYGRVAATVGEDVLLDRFMPTYDVVERHTVRVLAPPAVTLAAAKEMNLSQIPLVRAIFKGREILLGSKAAPQSRPAAGMLEQTMSLGWVVLADRPDREVVVGAVTQPWKANVVFRSIPPDQFAGFNEPNYVKIVWTLRADPADTTRSTFSTETRAVATDGAARRRFRWYWACLSPGIILIRWLSLRPIKAEAERRAHRPGPAGSLKGSPA